MPRIVPQKYPHPDLFGLAAWPNLCSWGKEPLRHPLVIKPAAELVNRQSRIKPHGVMPGRLFRPPPRHAGERADADQLRRDHAFDWLDAPPARLRGLSVALKRPSSATAARAPPPRRGTGKALLCRNLRALDD